jgi:hypothetical protein
MIENHVSISAGGNTSLRKSRSSWSAFERKIFCLAEGRQKYGRQDAKFFGVKNRAQVIAHLPPKNTSARFCFSGTAWSR